MDHFSFLNQMSVSFPSHTRRPHSFFIFSCPIFYSQFHIVLLNDGKASSKLRLIAMKRRNSFKKRRRRRNNKNHKMIYKWHYFHNCCAHYMLLTKSFHSLFLCSTLFLFPSPWSENIHFHRVRVHVFLCFCSIVQRQSIYRRTRLT